jgi:hypothetical protein
MVVETGWLYGMASYSMAITVTKSASDWGFHSTHTIDLPDRIAAKEGSIRNQLGRQNLEPYQRVELVTALEDLIAEEAKEKQREGGGAVHQTSPSPSVLEAFPRDEGQPAEEGK